MPKKSSQHTPKFRRHKATNQGYVELNGRIIYLGRFDHPDTQTRYYRVLAEWNANGRQLPVAPEEITVVEIIAGYLSHVKSYYVREDGTPTSEQTQIRCALAPVKELYGRERAVSFGPKALRTVRDVWLDRGLCRTTVNRYASEVKRLFKWAVSHELIPPAIYQALITVDGLRAGRSSAREPKRVAPIPEAHIQAIQPYVSAPVWAMVQLQLLTAGRPGEVMGLRAVDIDTSGPIWSANVANHKMAYQGRDRVLLFGPKAQFLLRSYMSNRPLNACLFSPKAHFEERSRDARVPRRPGQPETSRKTERKVRDRYDGASYRRAIARACEEAGVPPWNPHRLRHNAATRIRQEFGLDAAQAVLGHASANVTEIYAEISMNRAEKVIGSVG